MGSKTTLEAVASAAGVSIATVDRVINRRGGVSARSEALVLEWANRLNLDRRLFRGHLTSLRIAVLMPAPHNPFFRSLHDAFGDLNAQRQDLRITSFLHHIDVTDPHSISLRVAEIVENYHGLIVVCPNSPYLSAILLSHAGRLPIVTMVTDLPQSGRLAYIGANNRQLGRVAGEMMGRFVGPRGGKIGVVLGLRSLLGHAEREAGFRSVLGERFPNCEIAVVEESGEDAAQAGALVEAALRVHPDMKGIYNMSAGNTAIAQVMRGTGKAHEITLITHELTASRRRLLLEGVIDAVIDQNPRLEARLALEAVARQFNRADEQSQGAQYTPFDIILRENCPPDAPGDPA